MQAHSATAAAQTSIQPRTPAQAATVNVAAPMAAAQVGQVQVDKAVIIAERAVLAATVHRIQAAQVARAAVIIILLLEAELSEPLHRVRQCSLILGRSRTLETSPARYR